MTFYIAIKLIHLLPKVKCRPNSYIIAYLKFSTGNCSIVGKRGHWPASKDTSLPYLTFTGVFIFVYYDWQWLQRVCARISDYEVFSGSSRKPNHVLVNEYLPGQGIMVCLLLCLSVALMICIHEE